MIGSLASVCLGVSGMNSYHSRIDEIEKRYDEIAPIEVREVEKELNIINRKYGNNLQGFVKDESVLDSYKKFHKTLEDYDMESIDHSRGLIESSRRSEDSSFMINGLLTIVGFGIISFAGGYYLVPLSDKKSK